MPRRCAQTVENERDADELRFTRTRFCGDEPEMRVPGPRPISEGASGSTDAEHQMAVGSVGALGGRRPDGPAF